MTDINNSVYFQLQCEVGPLTPGQDNDLTTKAAVLECFGSRGHSGDLYHMSYPLDHGSTATLLICLYMEKKVRNCPFR
jgi:hypothetical protein